MAGGNTIITVGCMSDHGGVVITGDPIATVCGVPVARIGDLHACPQYTGDTPHGVTPIIQGPCGGYRGLMNGRPMAIATDRTGCGATLLPCNKCVEAKNTCN
jgi:uncharacterized Zn-binding protein involved in type VI secretion